MSVIQRWCRPCGAHKPEAMFYKSRLTACKECVKKQVAKHRAENIEAVRAYDRNRAREPHRIAFAKDVQAKWRKHQPERRAAQVAMGNAVRDKRVMPWPVCAIWFCVSPPEAHHPDYSQPLQAVWLCAAHHKQAHALARLPMKEAA